MKKIIEQYNTGDTVLAVTSYLSRENDNFNAVSEYSKRTLSYIARGRKVLILSEKSGSQKPFRAGKNVLVVPSWEKGNMTSFISLFFFILNLSAVKSVYVQFEFNVFGGVLPNLALLFLLLCVRLTGRQVTFELHQVITDIGKLVKHVRITNPVIQKFFNLGLKLYYVLLGIIASKIVVFEQELKDRLIGYADMKKVTTLFLPTAKKIITNREIARKKLGLPENKFLMMCFGFINGYKGFDWIIDSFKSFKNKDIRLVIAGGENPYLRDKLSYREFYDSIISAAVRNKNIIQTGFVPEDKVSLYFSAADLIVLPYEVFMAASGPFMLSLAHNKPVILSEKLEDYTKSADFSRSLELAGLSKNDIFFKLNNADLENLVNRVMTDREYRNKLATFSRTLNEKRSNFSFQSKMDNILFPKSLPGLITFISEPILVKS